jgi:hypothetical protein
MITDTAQIEIVKQSELGEYDTTITKAVYTCTLNGRTYVRFANGKSCFLQERTELTEPACTKQFDTGADNDTIH